MRIALVLALLSLAGWADTLLVATEDGGNTWRDRDPGSPYAEIIDLKAAADGSVLYAAFRTWTGSTLSVSQDEGRTWTDAKTFEGEALGMKLAVSRSAPDTVYLARSSGDHVEFFRSSDRGRTLSSVSTVTVGEAGNAYFYLASFVVDPLNPSAIYAGYTDFDFCGAGLSKSVDGGVTWAKLHASGCFDQLVIEPHRPQRVYVYGFLMIGGVGSWRFMISDDGGASFRVGADLAGCYFSGLAADDELSETLFAACYNNSGIQKSTDGGLSWRWVTDGTASSFVALPGPYVYATGDGSVFRSSDQGENWQVVLTGMRGTAAGFPFSGDRLLVGGFRSQPILPERTAYPRSIEGSARLAPGVLASLYGQRFTAETQSTSTPPFSTSLAGARILINGEAAPLLFASASQINFQVPFGSEGVATLEVQRANGTSERQSVNIYRTAAAVLKEQTEGGRVPLVFHSNGVDRVTPSNPVVRGETIIVHAIGLGDLQPYLEAGKLPVVLPLPTVKHAFPVYIYPLNGTTVTPDFVRASPDQVGVYHVGLTVPARSVIGTQRFQLGETVFDVPTR